MRVFEPHDFYFDEHGILWLNGDAYVRLPKEAADLLKRAKTEPVRISMGEAEAMFQGTSSISTRPLHVTGTTPTATQQSLLLPATVAKIEHAESSIVNAHRAGDAVNQASIVNDYHAGDAVNQAAGDKKQKQKENDVVQAITCENKQENKLFDIDEDKSFEVGESEPFVATQLTTSQSDYSHLDPVAAFRAELLATLGPATPDKLYRAKSSSVRALKRTTPIQAKPTPKKPSATIKTDSQGGPVLQKHKVGLFRSKFAMLVPQVAFDTPTLIS